MNPHEESLMSLGRVIRAAEDALPFHDGDFDQSLLYVRPAKQQRYARFLVPGFALAALGVVAILLLLPRQLSFQAGGARGVVGAWLSPDNADLPLVFSDGSRVVLAEAAQARVEQIDSAGARISLERGQADVQVVHRRTSRWTLVAGPFTVAVLGTRFSLRWDPLAQRLELTMQEGTVTLSGPVVGDARRVQRGERLTVLARDGRLETHQASTPSSTAPPETRPPPEPAPGSEPASAPSPVPARHLGAGHGPSRAESHAKVKQVPAWHVLARANRYQESISTVASSGLEGTLRSADVADLRLLGDTARLAGKPEVARRAFETIRTRFAGSDEAAVAAFLLGKLCFDNLRAYRDAVGWFTTYLAERPSGPLAREAAGRLIEARRKSGDDAGARAAARSYLARYPSGPHAGVARSVAGE